jgi:hypothetical protein
MGAMFAAPRMPNRKGDSEGVSGAGGLKAWRAVLATLHVGREKGRAR